MSRRVYTKFIRDVLRFAKQHGFEDAGCANSGHMKLWHPEKKVTVLYSSSPSDRVGAERNVRKDILRAVGKR